MIKQFLETFRKPSAAIIAQRELEDAERHLLSAQSAMEYAQAMCAYHGARIDRLSSRPKSIIQESAPCPPTSTTTPPKTSPDFNLYRPLQANHPGF